jgi:glycosyltransferase involved in cell wall biosynthesis
MRIAIFTETFLPKIDGIVIVLCHFLNYLADQGHDILLFAPEGGPDQYASAHVVGLPGYRFFLYPELTLVPPVKGIRKPLLDFAPDLIYLVNPASLGLAGIPYARLLGVPLVASYHTDVPGFAARWGMGYTQRPLWAYFRRVYNQSDLIYVPSNYTRKQIEAHGFERVKVWSHGVDSELYSPAKRSEEMRARLTNGEQEKTLLLYVGRVAAEKRIDWLLPIVQQYLNVRLAIVGDGPARCSLEKIFAGTPTIFTGYLHGEELAQAYASADIFAFPGANETFGNVVIEAMSSGLPVVAPNSGGLLDFVDDGANSLLFDAEDPEDMNTAIRQLLAEPELTRIIGRAARVKAETLSWDSVNEEVIQDFSGLIEERNKRRWHQFSRRFLKKDFQPDS